MYKESSRDRSEQGRLQLLRMEGAPVIWSEAIFPDGLDMFFGGVSHVVLPSVLRIIPGKRAHVLVPPGLGEDGSCGDGGVGRVSMDYGAVPFEGISVERPELVAVNEQEVRFDRQLPDSPLFSITGLRISLSFSLIFFESFKRGWRKSSGRITAAANTGPASGPLPASSQPASSLPASRYGRR